MVTCWQGDVLDTNKRNDYVSVPAALNSSFCRNVQTPCVYRTGSSDPVEIQTTLLMSRMLQSNISRYIQFKASVTLH